jgi:hypothetical protein
VTSALHEGVVVEGGMPEEAAAARRDVTAALDGFVARVRAARARLRELAGMLDGPPADADLVDGIQRAATRLRNGVLYEARHAAATLVDDAASNHGSIGAVAGDDVVVGLDLDDQAVQRHREVIELQRGVEELSFVITPLVGEDVSEAAPFPVRTPPERWTAADAFAELYR